MAAAQNSLARVWKNDTQLNWKHQYGFVLIFIKCVQFAVQKWRFKTFWTSYREANFWLFVSENTNI